MLIAAASASIEQFLENDRPEVLALNGVWGTGKTHFWHKTAVEAKQSLHPAFKRYAYVSLFGLTSIEDLKTAIFEVLIDRASIGEPLSIDTVIGNTAGAVESLSRSLFKFVKDSAPVNLGPALKSTAFATVRNSLICIDDFERKSHQLSIADVMGLVSYLKEQRNCKIVLIYDQGRFPNRDDLDAYARLREKVIDVGIEYAPSAQQCFDAVFDASFPYRVTLQQACDFFPIRNIRTLKRVRRAAEAVLPLLDHHGGSICKRACRMLVLFHVCQYEPAAHVPKLDDLRDFGHDLRGDRQRDTPWQEMLMEYRFDRLDGMSNALLNLVEKGFFSSEALKEFADSLVKKNEAMEAVAAYRSGWSGFRNSFRVSEQALLDRQMDLFEACASALSADDLNEFVHLCRDLDRPQTATKLIKTYIAQNARRRLATTLDPDQFQRAIDEELRDRFLDPGAQAQERSLAEVFESMSLGHALSLPDHITLSLASDEEIHRVIAEYEGDNLRLCIHRCLELTSTTDHLDISAKVKRALIRLADESRLNRLRVLSMHIDGLHLAPPSEETTPRI